MHPNIRFYYSNINTEIIERKTANEHCSSFDMAVTRQDCRMTEIVSLISIKRFYSVYSANSKVRENSFTIIETRTFKHEPLQRYW
ncbi:MAG: hypothetical protein ACI9JN_001626 [Bacteroidia bacterium]|jgi:hypothetical protein